MSQGSCGKASTCSSVEDFRGKQYPACVRKHAKQPFSVIFPQFSFGIGSGETLDEAVADAAYILAAGLQYLCEAGEEMPEPASMKDAAALLEDWKLADAALDSTSWVIVKVNPELAADE